MRKTLSRNSWSDKEDQLLLKTVAQYDKYILEYGLNMASNKLHRSLSAIRQRYYKLLTKQNEQLLKQQFIDAITTSDFRITKNKNKYIVII
jgi:hypothetical protein